MVRGGGGDGERECVFHLSDSHIVPIGDSINEGNPKVWGYGSKRLVARPEPAPQWKKRWPRGSTIPLRMLRRTLDCSLWRSLRIDPQGTGTEPHLRRSAQARTLEGGRSVYQKREWK